MAGGGGAERPRCRTPAKESIHFDTRHNSFGVLSAASVGGLSGITLRANIPAFRGNPVYIGVTEYDTKTRPGQHESIIDEALFHKVQAASALGVHEFSLLSRIQMGDITAARLRSGEMAIPASELERLLNMPVNAPAISSQDAETHFSDNLLGIKHEWGGLKRNGESVNYSVPGYPW